jgi:glyoxylase-like metal-dependent hydrolase (beta-lactamase superfamily II)
LRRSIYPTLSNLTIPFAVLVGDHAFDVQRLPGVTAGACALFEHATGVLFTGEVLVWDGNYVYDGEPPEVSDDADRVAFRASVQRLAALPAAAVCPGHFGRGNLDAMRAAIAGYIAGTNADQGANTYHDWGVVVQRQTKLT